MEKKYLLNIIDNRNLPDEIKYKKEYNFPTVNLDRNNIDNELLRLHIEDYASDTHGIALICDFDETCDSIMIILMDMQKDLLENNNVYKLIF